MATTPVTVAADPQVPGVPRKKATRRRAASSDSDKENEWPDISKRLFAPMGENAEEEEEESPNTFKKICLLDFAGDTNSIRRTLQEQSGLSDKILLDFKEALPSQIMEHLLPAAIYAVVDKCNDDFSRSRCQGCVLKEQDDDAHKCLLVNLSEKHGPVRRILQEYAGMTADDIPAVERPMARSAMYKLVTATAYSVIHYCANDLSFSNCQGCLLNEPGQLAHECLTWPAAFHEENLKHVCANLNTGPVLYVITVIGVSMNIFGMNQNHLVALANLVEGMCSAPKPSEQLRVMFQKCHQPYVKLVEKFLRHTFQNRLSLTTFL
ncbi:UNVERIFIED_CONTAM: hypothetical protein K2H54_007965 [Gekko kuhli]